MTSIRTILAASLALVSGSAMAQEATNPATKAYEQSMTAMHDTMQTMKPMNDPNMDFVMMMKPHHQAAVEMAETYLKYGTAPILKKMAQDIVSSQKKEIGAMDAWETKHGMKE